ncbi:MAG: hypothetical protein IKU89_03850 [Oscillospiraceae bacterium]|nr:hypothetical protein [Oscillospiraceae bacterium]
MTTYGEKHEKFLNNLGTNLKDLRALDEEAGKMFIYEVLIPYVCGKGTKEEENLADDIISMMTE